MTDFTLHRNEHMAQVDLPIGRIKAEAEAAHGETPAASYRRAKCTCGAEMDADAFAGHVEACKLAAVHDALDAMEAGQQQQTHNALAGVWWQCDCGVLSPTAHAWAEHAKDAGDPSAVIYALQRDTGAKVSTHVSAAILLARKQAIGSDPHVDYAAGYAAGRVRDGHAALRAKQARQQTKTQETTPMTTQTDRHPTIDLMFNGGARAGKMVLSAQAMRGVQALARKVADSYLPPEHRAILDTPVGQAIVDMLSPLLLHLVAEQGYLGDGRTREVIQATAGYAYEAQLFRHGFVLTDVMVKLTTDFASEFAEIKKLGEQITAAEATVDVTPERARVGADRSGA